MTQKRIETAADLAKSMTQLYAAGAEPARQGLVAVDGRRPGDADAA